MVAHLPEGDFHLPASDEPAHDLQRIASGIGAEQGLWREALLRIAQQHPSMPAASIRSRRDRWRSRQRRRIGTTGRPA
jgi:hypothetical protein